MIYARLCLLVVLAGCARAPAGGWPSLAPRPGETVQIAMPASQSPTDVAAADRPQTGPARADVAARLTSAMRDLDAAEARWRSQRKATLAAVAAAHGAAPGDAAWSAAQLELTRLEQAGAAFDDIRATLDGIAGDIAGAAAGGDGISSAQLSAVGGALARAKADTAAHARELTAARAG